MAAVDELRARVTEKGPWFEVPAGERASNCARCDADGLYWIHTKTGKLMLVDCAVPGGSPPDTHTSGRGVAHFATCPAAALFRTPRRAI
jgi:hypothetical protein